MVQYASRTDVGMRRAANQDSLAVRLCSEYAEWADAGHLFVVADGMGGHSVGDLASRISVETLPLAYFKSDAETIPERLLLALRAANKAISDKARENPEFADMGTTCSTLSLSPSGAFVGHVGDSRVYRVRGGEIQQLSFDHSLQWEMVRQGRATIETVDLLHPRNVITRCLGPDQNVCIDIEGPFHVQRGDRFVICSDGLTGHLTDTEIGAIAAGLPPSEAARLMINLANCRGGADNVTVVVSGIEKYPELTGHFVDSGLLSRPGGDIVSPDPETSSVASRISLLAFLFIGTLGLVLLALGQVTWGLVLTCPALILGFVRMMLVNGGTSSSNAHLTEANPQPRELPRETRPAATSPYRTAAAGITAGFLELLAEAQSELTQAATENNWNVDLKSLAALNRQALTAMRQEKWEQCLRLRARAIDELMKELYTKTRRN